MNIRLSKKEKFVLYWFACQGSTLIKPCPENSKKFLIEKKLEQESKFLLIPRLTVTVSALIRKGLIHAPGFKKTDVYNIVSWFSESNICLSETGKEYIQHYKDVNQERFVKFIDFITSIKKENFEFEFNKVDDYFLEFTTDVSTKKIKLSSFDFQTFVFEGKFQKYIYQQDRNKISCKINFKPNN